MELWDVYDKDRNKTNKQHKRGTPLPEGDYHIVVHVWIMNSDGQILITKRHPDKPHPNLWECPGGSVLAGEDSLDGAIREVNEEIGITLSKLNGRLIKSERRDQYHDFYDVWLFQQSFNLSETLLQQEEVTDIKWVTKAELDKLHEACGLVSTLSYYNIIFPF
ncbi:NUDIX hydrolase [Radiobacillus sp. PE A8.2]|uniref:NUDIX hydrolase n=1 Tax=Radiobacillus sp. PE A8.2 TaxID=3380349 RepID=UPI003890BC36